MGLFDKLTGGGDVKLTSKSALALAAITMIAIDGSVEEEELATLKSIVRGDENAFDTAFKVYKDRSVEECVTLVNQTLDDKQKAATMANLIDIAMADGMLAGAEKNLLSAYVEVFGLSEELIKDIVNVIAVKNDYSVFE